MSERTYAPRSGGRTAEPRITEPRVTRSRVTEPRVTEPRRRPSTGTEGDVRGARRRPTQAVPGRGRGDREGTGETTKPAATRAGGARTATRETGTLGVATGGRSARPATARRGTADRGGRTAPVQGTAALKLEPAVAEPLRVTGTAATPPRLRVAPPAPISAPRAPFIALIIALVIAGVIGILLINTKTNENSFEISWLQDQQATLDNRQQDLDNQLAVYDSVGNLDAAAKRLGLVKADAPAYIRLPDGKVIGVPRPGTGKPAVTAQDADDARKATAPQQGAGQQGAGQQGATEQGIQPGQGRPVVPDTGE